MRDRLAEALKELARSAGLVARVAEQRREDALRLLRHLEEGKAVLDCSYSPDTRPIDYGYVEAAVVAKTIMALEGERETGEGR